MMYTSKLLSDYNAVFQYEDKLKSTYKGYGISFAIDIIVKEDGYVLQYTARELEETI